MKNKVHEPRRNKYGRGPGGSRPSMQSCVLTYSRLRQGSYDSSGLSSVSMASPLRRARIKAQGFQLHNIMITYIVKAPTLSGFPASHSHTQGRERLRSVNPVPVWRQQNKTTPPPPGPHQKNKSLPNSAP